MDDRTRDRARGVLLGLACGDALAAQQAAGRDRPFLEMTGGGPMGLGAGEWTSVMAMALAICDSYIRTGADLELRDLTDRWVDLHQTGRHSCTGALTGAGSRTTLALHALSVGKGELIAAMSTPGDAPGAVARSFPVALRHMLAPARLEADALRQAAITHGPGASVLAQVMCLLVAGTASGHADHSRICAVPYVRAVSSRDSSSMGQSGALGAHDTALWCVAHSEGPPSAVARALRLGGCLSTVAITGALAGAIWGEQGLPPGWLERLAWRRRITDAADVLVGMAEHDIRTRGPGSLGSMK